MDLPPELRAAIEGLLDGASRHRLAARSQAISAAYRAGSASASAIRHRDDVIAYLIARMPATYAAVSAALHQTALVLPEFSPRRLLDIGAGPGTASFAATEQWPGLAEATLVDVNPAFVDMARHLSAASHSPALRDASFVEGEAARASQARAADLVLVAYALVEIPESQLAELITKLWQRCNGLLVLVEPGTSEGFRRILAARELLLRRGAHLAAPCPHALACPIAAPDWCHFSRRLARTRDHMQVKGASVPFEDEKFCYLAVSRAPVAGVPAARVLRPPRVSKLGWTATLCAEGRAFDRAVARRDAGFGHLRRLDWGDAVVGPLPGSDT